MDIALIVVLGVLGALLGSFAGAQVWRLRAHQLVEDNEEGEEVNAAELKRLKVLLRPALQDRSECLHCHHQLAWYDLIPIVSWISLGGKCRYCRRPIGVTEILLEVGLAAVFIGSHLLWPYALDSTLHIVGFAVWLIACVVMAILFVYDAKWSLLPFAINIALIFIGIVFQVVMIASGVHLDIWSLVGGVVLLGGLYLAFSLFGWVGMGDGILGVGLALLLGRWQYAFLALFIANLLGCFMLIPLYTRRELHRHARIPFGPFMILGALIVMLFGGWLLAMIFGPTGYLQNMLML
jgi:leader peptidase (prepilin peptidase) / N-methyltransferase